MTVVPSSEATELARTVRTQAEMGAALTLLKEESGLSYNQINERLADLPDLSRSTIHRLCSGGSLPATPESLPALVKACGVPDSDVGIWLEARERARACQRRPRGRRPNSAALSAAESTGTAADLTQVATAGSDQDPNLIDGEVVAVANHVAEHANEAGGEEDCDEDEVLGTITITRDHLRAAIVLSALIGLAATSSSTPGVRNVGAAVLGLATGLALREMLDTGSPPVVPVAA